MTTHDIKKGMMSLWKECFGDSDEYIKLVFDANFNADLIAVKDESGTIVSALTGVPYLFISNQKQGESLKGLYLCGLSTQKEKRSQGHMTMLLEEINKKAASRGFDFTFLIPSSEGIKEYYRHRGYMENFYFLEEHFAPGHIFDRIERSREDKLQIKRYQPEDSYVPLLEFLTKNCIPESLRLDDGSDPENLFFSLSHSEKDWEAIIKENIISGDEILVAYLEDKVVGVSFLYNSESALKIKRCIGSKHICASMLQFAEEEYRGKSIILCRNIAPDDYKLNDSSAIWSLFFKEKQSPESTYEEISEVNTIYSEIDAAKSFGMIRVCNPKAFVDKLGLQDLYKKLDFDCCEDFIKLLLQKPTKDPDSINRLLKVPRLNLYMSNLLE